MLIFLPGIGTIPSQNEPSRLVKYFSSRILFIKLENLHSFESSIFYFVFGKSISSFRKCRLFVFIILPVNSF